MEPTESESRHRLNGGGRSSAPAGSGEYIKVVESQCETDGFVNEQWTEPAMPGPVPWKTIIIILLLFIGGIVCIAFATLNWVTDTSRERSDRVWALGIIGALTFIPGSYYVYVLFCIMLNRNGFTMDEIRRLG
ncbi:uncharacterized protein LOC6732975 [Drosophila simulans]|uniref:Transmembrane protein 230 n=2 Tax=melanogaster subgroup TaxID=32351 RepID=B4Q3F8_DROSI|nr:uncharacterized protein LOC6732975 [Drosophila simulans]XP_033163728.1 uncharacterized protein LOC117143262 [Drosophila mauritiana]EDX05639.1 GD24272 [Drosophila simulans]KMY91184.1 uncharacterized protein Dsimw501_GD24272 [Drosophila simulans]